MSNPHHHTEQQTGFTRVATSSAWLSAYRVMRMLVAFGVGIVVARYLGPEDYGKLHYALALVMILMGIIGPGMKDVIVRHWDTDIQNRHEIMRASFRMLLVSNFVMLGLVLLIALLLRPDESLIILMAAAIGLGNLFRAFEIYELWFHYKLEMGKTVMVQGTSFLAMAVLKITGVFMGWPVFYFAVIFGLELIVVGIGFLILFKFNRGEWSVFGTFSFIKTAKPIFVESLPSIASVAFILILFKSDQVMLGWLLNDTEVGFYAVAVPFSEYWAFLAIAIMTSVYPALLNAKKTSEAAFNIYFRRVAGFLTWLAICIMVSVWFFGEFVISFFLGDTYLPSASILQIHVWSLYFIFMIEVARKWYVINKQLPLYLYISGIAAMSNIGLNMWLIPQYGGIGAAWATIASYAFAGIFGLFLFRETRRTAIILLSSVTVLAELPQLIKQFTSGKS